MGNNAIRFACNGCGTYRKGWLVPLTLYETRQWLKRGHEVAILLKVFDELYWSLSQQEFAHAKGRAVEATSGDASIHVIARFAGNSLNSYQNLGDNKNRGIYGERPLVCRIYPAEINSFITLNPANKICTPDVWEEGEVLFTVRIIDPALVKHIERSQKADRDDARAKIALCEILGLNVAAWKGNAFTVYLLDREQLLVAFVFATHS